MRKTQGLPILAVPLTSYVTLKKLLNLPESYFLISRTRRKIPTNEVAATVMRTSLWMEDYSGQKIK